MTNETARGEVVQYWLRKADAALESAHAEFQARRNDFAVNRLYYACFYAASAVLLAAGKTFVKHAGLRGAVHQDLVKTDKLAVRWGKVFDRIFESRQSADYVELHEFDAAQLVEMIAEAEGFVAEMKRLLSKP